MKHPTSNRDYRAPWHDYRSRRIYMITIKTLPGGPTLANIIDAATPRSEPTPAGRCVEEAFLEVIAAHPSMSIIEHVIMPDHAHYVIFVREQLDRPLGEYIGWVKSKATSKLRALFNSPERNFLQGGFNDRILSGEGQLQRMINYVCDNPRRLLIRRANSEYYISRHKIEFAGMKFEAFGNLQLLREIEFEPVIIHRAWSAEELEAARSRWQRCVRNSGVLVSPFISKAEKEVLQEAIEAGGRVIVVTSDLITDKYKPSGRYFELCGQGRLLMLHPAEMTGRAYGGITRAEALALNSAAERIADATSAGASARLPGGLAGGFCQLKKFL